MQILKLLREVLVVFVFAGLLWLIIEIAGCDRTEQKKEANVEQSVTTEASASDKTKDDKENESSIAQTDTLPESNQVNAEEIALTNAGDSALITKTSKVSEDTVTIAEIVTNASDSTKIAQTSKASSDSVTVAMTSATQRTEEEYEPAWYEVPYDIFIQSINPSLSKDVHSWGKELIVFLLFLIVSFGLSGLIFTIIINLFERRKEKWENGEINYDITKDFILIIGGHKMVIQLCADLLSPKQLKPNENLVLVIQTRRKAIMLRKELEAKIGKEQTKRVFIYNGDRTSEDNLKVLNPQDAEQIYIIGEENHFDGNSHDAFSLQCLNILNKMIAKDIEKKKKLQKNNAEGQCPVQAQSESTPAKPTEDKSLKEVKPESENGAKTETNNEVKPESENNTKPETENKVKSETEKGNQPVSENKANPESEKIVKTESEETGNGEQADKEKSYKKEIKDDIIPCHVMFEYQSSTKIFQYTDRALCKRLDFIPFNYYEKWAAQVLVFDTEAEPVPAKVEDKKDSKTNSEKNKAEEVNAQDKAKENTETTEKTKAESKSKEEISNKAKEEEIKATDCKEAESKSKEEISNKAKEEEIKATDCKEAESKSTEENSNKAKEEKNKATECKEAESKSEGEISNKAKEKEEKEKAEKEDELPKDPKIKYPFILGKKPEIFQDQNKRVHIIIIGMSKMGTMFGAMAAHVCHFPNFFNCPEHPRTLITFIDRDAKVEMNYFKGRNPSLCELSRWRYVDAEKYCRYIEAEDDTQTDRLDERPIYQKEFKGIDPMNEIGAKSIFLGNEIDPGLMDIDWEFIKGDIGTPSIQKYLQDAADDDDCVTTIAVCIPVAYEAVSASMFMPEDVYQSDNVTQVLVLQHSSDAVVLTASQEIETEFILRKTEENSKIEEHLKINPYKKLRPFGMFDQCSYVNHLDILPMIINYIYDFAPPKIKNNIDAIKEWQEEFDKLGEDLCRDLAKTIQINEPYGIINTAAHNFVHMTTQNGKSVQAKRASNFYNSYSIPFKAQVFQIAPSTKPLDRNKTEQEKIILEIAQTEHNRWDTEQIFVGYRPRLQKDKAKYSALVDNEVKYGIYEEMKEQKDGKDVKTKVFKPISLEKDFKLRRIHLDIRSFKAKGIYPGLGEWTKFYDIKIALMTPVLYKCYLMLLGQDIDSPEKENSSQNYNSNNAENKSSNNSENKATEEEGNK